MEAAGWTWMLTLPGERLDWDSQTWGRSGGRPRPPGAPQRGQAVPRCPEALGSVQGTTVLLLVKGINEATSLMQRPTATGASRGAGEGGAGFWRCWLGDAALQVSPGGRELQVQTRSPRCPPRGAAHLGWGCGSPCVWGCASRGFGRGPRLACGARVCRLGDVPLWSTWCLQVGWGGVLGALGAAGPSVLWRWGDRQRPAGCTREECARLPARKPPPPASPVLEEVMQRSSSGEAGTKCRGQLQAAHSPGCGAHGGPAPGCSLPGLQGPRWASSRLFMCPGQLQAAHSPECGAHGGPPGSAGWAGSGGECGRSQGYTWRRAQGQILGVPRVTAQRPH